MRSDPETVLRVSEAGSPMRLMKLTPPDRLIAAVQLALTTPAR